jgi:hypothetical protein
LHATWARAAANTGVQQAFEEFGKAYGLPITFLLFALLTGARGWWYFKFYVTDLKAQYEAREGQYKERLAELKTDRDDWKTQAQTATAALDALSKGAKPTVRSPRTRG